MIGTLSGFSLLTEEKNINFVMRSDVKNLIISEAADRTEVYKFCFGFDECQLNKFIYKYSAGIFSYFLLFSLKSQSEKCQHNLECLC